MQTLPSNEAALVEAILASIGMTAPTVQFLTVGATSRVWRAETSDAAVVIRLAAPAPQKEVRFDADVGVRQRLTRVDKHIAEPLAVGRWSLATSSHDAGVSWCVDRFILGETAPRGAIPARVCRELGAVLAHLHALPVTHYGLLEDRRDLLIGQAPDAVSGLLTRLQDPWPFTERPLTEHPIVRAAPDLLAPLTTLEDRLRGVAQARQYCLNHTDLHEKQLRIADARLVGLLDFGDATIGPPAWDIASFAYFHGWPLARLVLAGYTADEETFHHLLADAWGFSILIALHHASRSVSLQRPQRMQSAIQFLRDTVVQPIESHATLIRQDRRSTGAGES